MSFNKESSIILIVFFIAAAILSPPDVISQLTLAIPMIIIYVVLRLVVPQFKSFKQTPTNVIALKMAYMCFLSIIMAYLILKLLNIILD